MIVAAIAFAALPACGGSATNIIILIGDGMGYQQVKSGAYYKGAPLCFESWTHRAMAKTALHSGGITDSAAAGTAIATGEDVDSGVVSIAQPGDQRELETLLEYFKRKGKWTGLVTTTTMTHATPAAFGAHELSRGSYAAIASDYLNQTKPNVLLGGGANGMTVAAAQTAGYTVVTNAAGMTGLDTSTETMVSGQFGTTHLPYEYDGLGTLPHLSDMTSTALEILERGTNGFFLMVEGGKIDHACHNNDIARSVRETVEFDNTVQVVLNWVSNRTDTLVLVTADHETGGMHSVIDNGQGVTPTVSWTSTGHTSSNVGAWATGPKADLVTGEMDNNELFHIVRNSYFFESRAATPDKAGDSVTIDWSVRPGDVYRLECADTPDAVNWTEVGVVTAALETISITDTNAGASARRFYRLQAVD